MLEWYCCLHSGTKQWPKLKFFSPQVEDLGVKINGKLSGEIAESREMHEWVLQ